MDTLAELTTASRRYAGRIYIGLGIAATVLGPVLYWMQVVHAKHLTVPWYVPILGTVGVALSLVALFRARSFWRILAIVLLSLLAAGEWFFVAISKLPAYSGPVAADQAFPAFTTSLADGSAFDQNSLKGEQNTVMVFFRGRW